MQEIYIEFVWSAYWKKRQIFGYVTPDKSDIVCYETIFKIWDLLFLSSSGLSLLNKIKFLQATTLTLHLHSFLKFKLVVSVIYSVDFKPRTYTVLFIITLICMSLISYSVFSSPGRINKKDLLLLKKSQIYFEKVIVVYNSDYARNSWFYYPFPL